MSKLIHLLPKDPYDDLKIVETFQFIPQLAEFDKQFKK